MDSLFVSFERYFDARDLSQAAFAFMLKLLAAIATLLVGMALIKLVVSIFRPAANRLLPDPTVRSYTVSVVRIGLMVLLGLVLLSVFGVETTSFVAIIGAAGIAVGLALQGTLSNFASGFMLLVFRPFKLGDEIETAGVTGTVSDIGIFSTTVDTPEHVRAFIPNSKILGDVIRNKSVLEYLRIEMRITVSNDTDVDRAHQIIQRVLHRNELVLEAPHPEVRIVEDDSAGVTFAVRPSIRLEDEEAVRTTVRREMRTELKDAGIEVIRQ